MTQRFLDRDQEVTLAKYDIQICDISPLSIASIDESYTTTSVEAQARLNHAFHRRGRPGKARNGAVSSCLLEAKRLDAGASDVDDVRV